MPFYPFSSTAESFGVSAQIGSGVVRGGPEVRLDEGSTRVPPGFHQGSTRVPRASACCWGYHLSLFFGRVPLLRRQNRGKKNSWYSYSNLSNLEDLEPLTRRSQALRHWHSQSSPRSVCFFVDRMARAIANNFTPKYTVTLFPGSLAALQYELLRVKLLEDASFPTKQTVSLFAQQHTPTHTHTHVFPISLLSFFSSSLDMYSEVVAPTGCVFPFFAFR